MLTLAKQKKLVMTTLLSLAAVYSGASLAAPAAQADHTWPQSTARAQDDLQRVAVGPFSNLLNWLRTLASN